MAPPRAVRRAVAAAAALVLAAASLTAVSATPAAAAGTLLSQGKTATASSVENSGSSAANAVDGNASTRWSSAFSDPQWLQVDLGQSASITQVTLQWEAAYGKAYQLQTSNDASSWTTIYSTSTGAGGTENLTVSGSGRYVRMYGTARATGYGYSLWEFQVYGSFGSGSCGTANAALNKPASASSTENAGSAAGNAFDGNTGTRWSSAFSDPQWIQVDLGASQSICKVTLQWEAAYGKAYQLQTSNDASSWTTIYSTSTGAGGTENLTVSGSGRYVRMYGTARATTYGYSLWEFGVFTGSGGGGGTGCGSTLPTSNTPNFGPNVYVFGPTQSSSSIQSTLDSVFSQQETNQFGTARYALLFKPGSYSVQANIGFYTSISGLGLLPDDTTINGDVTVDAGWLSGNATQNFWRSAENLAIVPSSGTDRWAVAQAAPFRRIHVRGGLTLMPNGGGWASGGYLSDTKVDGQVTPGSQQQWFSKDSTFGSWSGGVWNMVFSGVQGAPAASWPSPPETVVAATPVTREKPFLYVDSAGNYNVFVPSLRTNASGVTWAGGSDAGTSIPMNQFYVATPADSAATLNSALCQGLNLFFTPGVYHVDQTINVTRADTVVMGIGMATIIPDNGVNAMSVADVSGVKISGLLFDAGTTNSDTLLQVGPSVGASHAADPILIQDVFFRIGGAVAGKASKSLVVNANDTVIDHIWAWRADHGNAGTYGWTVNTADNGLIVNGNNVDGYGLFVEHYQKYEVTWNGNNGKVIFFQNEMPYDPPSQSAWMNGTTNGWAAIKVASGVTSWEGWGLGSYCNFTADATISGYHAFEVPNATGVKLHDMVTVSLGGVGTITHVVNDTGATANTANNNSYLQSYP